MLRIIFISTFIVSTFAQLTTLESPNYTPMTILNQPKMTGRWYQIARFASLYELYHTCSIANFNLLNNGTVDIKVTSISELTGDRVNWSGQGDPINEGNSEFNIRFSPFALQRKSTLAVLDTDYENFAVMIMIQNASDSINFVYAWIISKKPSLDKKYISRSLDVLNANHIRTDGLDYVKHDNCPEMN